jgi:pyrroloquinoline quinone biosynthesis protein E
MNEPGPPLWLLAELTYACPLQCPYCSNPLDFNGYRRELDTDTWVRVLREARGLGAVQLGFSGGEPLLRDDLEVLVEQAHGLGYYTNLITSGLGLDAERAERLRRLGLDHVQISFQADERELNDLVAGGEAFDRKLAAARAVKANGFPMVLCFVVHRGNIGRVDLMLELALELGADYVELASVQYAGWAAVNRAQLLPTGDQLRRAESVAHEYQRRTQGRMTIYYVVADYYEGRPKPCMNGWGTTFLAVAPDGTALPCHSARSLPGLDFPNVRDRSIEWIWRESPAFNRFRGESWMQEPCRSCPERASDHGGCRCQAYLLTGDVAATDPVCDKSPRHEIVEAARTNAEGCAETLDVDALRFRTAGNARTLETERVPRSG